MPRPNRCTLDADWHHIAFRGNRGQPLFLDDGDRLELRELLAKGFADHDVVVVAECQMTNHVHLIVHGPIAAVSAALHWALTTYACRFNRRHGLDGRLLQRRFTSVPIRDPQHLPVAVLYTLDNPRRAGLVPSSEAWPWSTCATTLGLEPAPGFVDVARAAAILGGVEQARRLLAPAARVVAALAPPRRPPELRTPLLVSRPGAA